MQKDDHLAAEDARRRTQREAIKGEVGQRVRDEVLRLFVHRKAAV
jgi:hypothetical protein